MTSLDTITIEADDATAAERFYATAFDLGSRVRVRHSDAATSGFRGFTTSLIVAQPSTVTALIDAAVGAGARTITPVKKSMWGYGGVVQAPDGAIWKVATSAKKDTGTPTRDVDQIVLLLAAADVSASKHFYVEHGLKVGRSFGKYVEFAMPTSPVRLGLYGRKALAKDAGISPDGSGSHRLVLGSDAGAFTDPDGFVWEPASS